MLKAIPQPGLLFCFLSWANSSSLELDPGTALEDGLNFGKVYNKVYSIWEIYTFIFPKLVKLNCISFTLSFINTKFTIII